MSEDEQFQQAFGEHTGISERCREQIDQIKDNTKGLTCCNLAFRDVVQFTDPAWELLGRYIANNSNLSELVLNHCGLTDQQISSLFRTLTSSVSLEILDLDFYNLFGIEGLRSMIPFFEDSPNLSQINLGRNRNINTECFELLVQRLDGKSVANLCCQDCNINDISSLEVYNLSNLLNLKLSGNSIESISALDTAYTLPNLQRLNLGRNNIGRDGCIILSNLLQREGSPLSVLILEHTNMGDEEAEIIATSLKHNTTLQTLDLRNNKSITERCYKAFLKLLVDASSIENTYNSNHTLKSCCVGQYLRNDVLDRVYEASALNEHGGNPKSIGRLKVIKYQLNSTTRKNLCSLQGIEYCNNPFADIEPILLPNILALIGEKRGQSDLYAALVPTAPELLSYIDREAMMRSIMESNMARIDALAKEMAPLIAQNADMERRLELAELGGW